MEIEDAARTYRRLANESIVRLLLSTAALLEEMKKPDYKKCAADLGWLRFLTIDQFQYFYQPYRKEGAVAGWRKVENAFSDPESLKVISDSARSCALVKMRVNVIQRGLDAHRDRDYVASVSILLPQVEGIVWDIGVAKGLVFPERNSKRRSSGRGNWTFGSLVDEIWPTESPVDKFQVKMKKEYYSENLRHPCLHGRDMSFFNRECSTRVVMMIWGVIEEARRV